MLWVLVILNTRPQGQLLDTMIAHRRSQAQTNKPRGRICTEHWPVPKRWRRAASTKSPRTVVVCRLNCTMGTGTERSKGNPVGHPSPDALLQLSQEANAKPEALEAAATCATVSDTPRACVRRSGTSGCASSVGLRDLAHRVRANQVPLERRHATSSKHCNKSGTDAGTDLRQV